MKPKIISEELRPEYVFDYSKVAHGKYFKRLLEEGAKVLVHLINTISVSSRRVKLQPQIEP